MVCDTVSVENFFTFSTVNQSDLEKCTSGWCTDQDILAFYTPDMYYDRIHGDVRVKFSDGEADAAIQVYDVDIPGWVTLTGGKLEASIDGWTAEYDPWGNYPDFYPDDFVYWLRKSYPSDQEFSPSELNDIWIDWQDNPTTGCDPEDQPLWVHSDDEIGPFADDVNTGEINVSNKSDRWLILAYHEFGDGCAHDIQSACDAQGVIQDELLDRDITGTHEFFDVTCVSQYYYPPTITVTPGEWVSFDYKIDRRRLYMIALNVQLAAESIQQLDFRNGKLHWW